MPHNHSKISEPSKKNHIELFAGCGGLCLGLESENIELFFANELSPMAAETFAYNILNEDLAAKSKVIPRESAESTLWLNSRYRKEYLAERLKENPQEPPEDASRHSEPPRSTSQLERKLLVGSIIDLNEQLEQNPSLLEEIRHKEVDLVSGGPPCQSFSMAGLRQHDNTRNTLPRDFAKFVGMVQPKVAVLENVTGILRAFTIPTDVKHIVYHAWHEVAKAFAQEGYFPICLHVNAKYVGVAQNRPRFLLFAIREDIFESIEYEGELGEVFQNSSRFFNKVRSKPSISLEDSGLKYWDIEKDQWVFRTSLFSSFLVFEEERNDVNSRNGFHSVKEAINDYAHYRDRSIDDRYVKLINSSFEKCNPRAKIKNPLESANQKQRLNNIKVRQRFRLYQVLAEIGADSPEISREVTAFIRDPSKCLSESALSTLREYKYLQETDSKPFEVLRKFTANEESEFLTYLRSLGTKKQTQRALIADSPAPAALSIPDDACHYSTDLEDIRTLSVREMARIQSFPDWFEFRSKETTGGKMRRFQVPQYTQVGNAVPPLLGKAIGKAVHKLLDFC